MTWHPDMPDDLKNTVVTGNAYDVAERIPDRSVQMVFTDAVYQDLAQYRWLAKEAMRICEDVAPALIWCSKPKADKVKAIFVSAGWEYVYDLDYVVIAKTGRMRQYNLFCWTTPCLWLQKGKTRPWRWIPDTYVDQAGNVSSKHKWNKSLPVILEWLDAFSRPGWTVWDPFAGSGTVGVAATMLGRNFLASELVEEIAADARERIAATRPMTHRQQPIKLLIEQSGMDGFVTPRRTSSKKKSA